MVMTHARGQRALGEHRFAADVRVGQGHLHQGTCVWDRFSARGKGLGSACGPGHHAYGLPLCMHKYSCTCLLRARLALPASTPPRSRAKRRVRGQRNHGRGRRHGSAAAQHNRARTAGPEAHGRAVHGRLRGNRPNGRGRAVFWVIWVGGQERRRCVRMGVVGRLPGHGALGQGTAHAAGP